MPDIQDGYVLDEIVQARRDTQAAKRLLVRLLKKQGLTPKRIITDKLRSYSAAKRDVMPAVEHRSHKGLNNRAENSHVPLRKRERVMQGFRVSYRSFQQSEISSFPRIGNVQPFPLTSTGSAQWRSGKP
ncbi:DDE domain protein (plasmid) [Rhizobium leguminosarum bv. viciae]|uniref:DDE-type integrase/transposase/recombinase n=1 Tax=Rhizobium leguminosarum TaxID=384 RepID=UPI000CE29746|nr:DDE domain protein [Rhizobium leguminosarum bv. viciae]